MASFYAAVLVWNRHNILMIEMPKPVEILGNIFRSIDPSEAESKVDIAIMVALKPIINTFGYTDTLRVIKSMNPKRKDKP